MYLPELEPYLCGLELCLQRGDLSCLLSAIIIGALCWFRLVLQTRFPQSTFNLGVPRVQLGKVVECFLRDTCLLLVESSRKLPATKFLAYLLLS